MRWVLTLAVLSSLSGCGGPQAPPASPGAVEADDGTSSGEGTGGAGAGRQRPAACPPRFGAQGPDCLGQGASLRCVYPEGSCYCGQPRRCSGMRHAATPPMWICQAPEPPCTRTPGDPCQQGEQGCQPFCCGVAIECVEGVWSPVDVPCPP